MLSILAFFFMNQINKFTMSRRGYMARKDARNKQIWHVSKIEKQSIQTTCLQHRHDQILQWLCYYLHFHRRNWISLTIQYSPCVSLSNIKAFIIVFFFVIVPKKSNLYYTFHSIIINRTTIQKAFTNTCIFRVLTFVITLNISSIFYI